MYHKGRHDNDNKTEISLFLWPMKQSDIFFKFNNGKYYDT